VAPPQFDAAFVDATQTGNTLSVTVAANSNRVLYFYCEYTASSVTRNGQSFTDLTGEGYFWRLVNPSTGTSDITAAGVANYPVIQALSLYNADQTTPERTSVAEKSTGFGAPWTSSVTSDTDDLVIDIGTVSGNTFSTTESGQVERIETVLTAPLAGYRALSSTRVATGTTTYLSWTGSSIGSGFLYLFAVRAAPATSTPAFGRYRIAGARR
jgi:hypothetical protein